MRCFVSSEVCARVACLAVIWHIPLQSVVLDLPAVPRAEYPSPSAVTVGIQRSGDLMRDRSSDFSTPLHSTHFICLVLCRIDCRRTLSAYFEAGALGVRPIPSAFSAHFAACGRCYAFVSLRSPKSSRSASGTGHAVSVSPHAGPTQSKGHVRVSNPRRPPEARNFRGCLQARAVPGTSLRSPSFRLVSAERLRARRAFQMSN